MVSVSKTETGRPVSATLAIIAGAIMVASGLLAVGMMSMFSQLGAMQGYSMGGMMMGGWGMTSSAFMWGMVATMSGLTIGLGAILIVGGYSIQKSPDTAGRWGVAILIASIVGLLGMSGFFFGPVLGIIAGILALSKR